MCTACHNLLRLKGELKAYFNVYGQRLILLVHPYPIARSHFPVTDRATLIGIPSAAFIIQVKAFCCFFLQALLVEVYPYMLEGRWYGAAAAILMANGFFHN